jgi:hypothetical protein
MGDVSKGFKGSSGERKLASSCDMTAEKAEVVEPVERRTSAAMH